jgi:hypothetical protein
MPVTARIQPFGALRAGADRYFALGPRRPA